MIVLVITTQPHHFLLSVQIAASFVYSVKKHKNTLRGCNAQKTHLKSIEQQANKSLHTDQLQPCATLQASVGG